ncbi:MAG: ribosome recycling factor, partial [Clostridia bacterium]|nr:ribosome recycling factor [Clostridia bacterium]
MAYSIKDFETKMQKSVDSVEREFSNVRAGRANPSVLDRVQVDYYGTPTPINQMAQVTVPEARSILITPWDSKLLRDIEQAIQKSDLGINPQNDGKSL